MPLSSTMSGATLTAILSLLMNMARFPPKTRTWQDPRSQLSRLLRRLQGAIGLRSRAQSKRPAPPGAHDRRLLRARLFAGIVIRHAFALLIKRVAYLCFDFFFVEEIARAAVASPTPPLRTIESCES